VELLQNHTDTTVMEKFILIKLKGMSLARNLNKKMLLDADISSLKILFFIQLMGSLLAGLLRMWSMQIIMLLCHFIV
jgi:hypothetical protein